MLWLCSLNTISVLVDTAFAFRHYTSDHIIFIGSCSFEPGLCGWKDNSLGVYQWDRNKGKTIVAGTGPSVDHTCGNASCK